MDEEGLDPIEKLKRELEREREEKEDLAAQYRNLLAKLTTMRTSLGNKLRQDAEELDRREQHIQHLTAQNEDLVSTVETLKAELIASHEEAERNSKELDTIRSQVLNENAQESLLRERELRETLSELERCRLERGEWERASMQEKMLGDEARLNLETLRRDLEMEREVRARESVELVAARETATNLQSVLEDFSASKEHELSQAVKDYRSQLDDVVMSLAEFKRRALDAEAQLDELKINASRTQELEQDIKEKNLLIGKLRHEGLLLSLHMLLNINPLFSRNHQRTPYGSPP
jgi:chromosome segregation ATPase